MLCKDKDNLVPSPWLTVKGAARYLHMSIAEFTAHVNTGEIPSYRRGRARYVNTEDLDRWMRSLPSGASPLSMVADGSTSVV